MKTQSLRFLLLIALIFSLLTPSTIAHAASLVVNSLLDTVGVDGTCTLREAIQNANNNAATNADCVAGSGADTSTFSVSGTIALGSTLPNIADAAGLTMDGTGQTVTISGGNVVRVLRVDASLTLNDLTIANGNATDYNGGGIYNTGSSTLTITNSTFSGNGAPGLGGGGGVYNFGGTMTITNSAFAGNTAAGGWGGGVFTTNGGTLTITNSTFSGNTAADGWGGGVYNGGSTVTLSNTIVANSASGGNCGGAVTNGGNNIDSGTTCGWVSASGSMSSTNPLLGALANNGGPTQTFALLAGSPAIDAGDDATCGTAPVNGLDQRGVTRPQGANCDIGSYESVHFYRTYLPLVMR